MENTEIKQLGIFNEKDMLEGKYDFIESIEDLLWELWYYKEYKNDSYYAYFDTIDGKRIKFSPSNYPNIQDQEEYYAAEIRKLHIESPMNKEFAEKINFKEDLKDTIGMLIEEAANRNNVYIDYISEFYATKGKTMRLYSADYCDPDKKDEYITELKKELDFNKDIATKMEFSGNEIDKAIIFLFEMAKKSQNVYIDFISHYPTTNNKIFRIYSADCQDYYEATRKFEKEINPHNEIDLITRENIKKSSLIQNEIRNKLTNNLNCNNPLTLNQQYYDKEKMILLRFVENETIKAALNNNTLLYEQLFLILKDIAYAVDTETKIEEKRENHNISNFAIRTIELINERNRAIWSGQIKIDGSIDEIENWLNKTYGELFNYFKNKETKMETIPNEHNNIIRNEIRAIISQKLVNTKYPLEDENVFEYSEDKIKVLKFIEDKTIEAYESKKQHIINEMLILLEQTTKNVINETKIENKSIEKNIPYFTVKTIEIINNTIVKIYENMTLGENQQEIINELEKIFVTILNNSTNQTINKRY